MDELPGNSHTEKSQAKPPPKEKVIEKIELSAPVVRQKKSLGTRFKNTFFGGDFKTALFYVGTAVLIPALKNLVFDSITEGAKRTIWRDAPQRGYRPTAANVMRTQYNNPVRRDPREDPRYHSSNPMRPNSARPGEAYEIDPLMFATLEDAENTRERMMDIIDQYGVVGVDDLNNMLGLMSTYVDAKWGWTNLVNSSVRQVREGYILELPNPEPL